MAENGWLHKPGDVLNAMPKSVQAKTKGCLSQKTGLATAFKLKMSVQGKWQKPDGSNPMPYIIQGFAFVDGIKQLQPAV